MSNLIKETNSSKWQKLKDALKEGLDVKQANLLDVLMDNTRNEYVSQLNENASAGAVSTGNIATLNKVVLPILRRVMPSVMVTDLVGVQPMTSNVGQIVSMRYVYGTTSAGAGVVAGQEALAPAHIRDLAVAYSGNENAAVPAAAPTSTLEGVPGNTVKLETLKQTVTAGTRRLAARWTIESETDANNAYGFNLQDELLAAAALHITTEIDQEILRSLRSLPAAATAANTFDQGAVSGQAVSVVDEFGALAVLINRQANLIATRTRLGKANWCVVSPTAQTILESARASAFVRTTEGAFEAPTNNKYVGTLNNAMKVYCDTYASDDTSILVGLKRDDLTAPTYYCPYVPLSTTGVIQDPNTLERVAGFYTRYAHAIMTNSATSLGNSADYLGVVGINASSLTFL